MVTDADLLQRCRDQDNDAWCQLVARYERLVYSVARRNGAKEDDAEDITQVVFLELFASLDRIKDEDRLASWLMTVARRQAWRLIDARKKTVPLDTVPDLSEEPLADHAVLLSLREAVKSLDEKSKSLIWHLFFSPESPDYATIAEQMDCSIGSIGPLRGRSLSKIKSHLEAV